MIANTSSFLNKAFALAMLALGLSACASGPNDQNAQATPNLNTYFVDTHFAGYEQLAIPSTDDIFSLDANVKQFVSDATRLHRSEEERMRSLAEAIFARSKLNLLYDAGANTKASDTFLQRSANCLSLTIMTFAMAEYAGFRTDFQEIHIPEYWTRRSGYALLNGHINLRIKPGRSGDVINVFQKDLVVDFDPQEGSRQFSSSVISRSRIVAMFYSNKAVDAFLLNDYVSTYAFLKRAAQHDSEHGGIWVNLGLLYRHIGAYEMAELAYQRAIELDKNNLTAWENLAFLYSQLGREKWAQEIKAKVAAKREQNPFFHMMLAEQARTEQDWQSSIRSYRRAIDLDDNPHEFYFGLASVFVEQGDYDRGEKYLKIAQRKARSNNISERYARKLSYLNLARSD